MIKACIFDLDGTLLDTVRGITYYINLQLEREGLPLVSESEAASFLGHGAYDLIASALASRGVTDAEAVVRVLARYNADYNAAPTYLVEPYDGILDMISALAKGGIRLGVLSNKPDFAAREIVKRYFGADMPAHGAIDGVPLKPNPQSLYAFMDELGVSPDECVFVGDSEYDVMTAQNAGVRLVAVGWGLRAEERLRAAGAQAVISHPSELVKIIFSDND